MRQRLEKVRDQGGGVPGVIGVFFAELGAHPLFFHAELDPEREEEESEGEESAHLGDGDGHAEESGQNAGVDGMADQGVGTGGDQFVVLLDGDGAAPVAAEVLARPDGEEKAGDGDGCSQPEGPKASRPELEVEPGQRDARCGEEDDHDEEDEEAQDARGGWFEALGGLGIDGFDLPVEEKDNPDYGEEGFVEPEHTGLRVLTVFTQVRKGKFRDRRCFATRGPIERGRSTQLKAE